MGTQGTEMQNWETRIWGKPASTGQLHDKLCQKTAGFPRGPGVSGFQLCIGLTMRKTTGWLGSNKVQDRKKQ